MLVVPCGQDEKLLPLGNKDILVFAQIFILLICREAELLRNRDFPPQAIYTALARHMVFLS